MIDKNKITEIIEILKPILKNNVADSILKYYNGDISIRKLSSIINIKPEELYLIFDILELPLTNLTLNDIKEDVKKLNF